MARNDVFIEFTTEEIVVLCDAGEIGLPVSFADEPLGHLTESRTLLAKANAQRALVARRALEGDENGTLRPIEAISTILEVAANPGIVSLITLEKVEEDDVDVRTLAVMPELGVELRKVGTNLHRLTPFAPEDLLVRLVRLLDLRPMGAAHATSFVTAFEALEACGEAVEDPELGTDAAVAALVGSGVDAPSANQFVDALSMRVGSANVAVFHKPDDETMEGGTLAFIDAGMGGYWQTDASDEADGPRVATVTSVDAATLAKQLLEFLPEAFSDMVPRSLKPLLG